MATVMTRFISHLPTHYRFILVSLMLLHWCDEENRLKTYKTLGLKTNPTSETCMSHTGLFIYFVILLRVDKPYMATMVYRGIFLIYHGKLWYIRYIPQLKALMSPTQSGIYFCIHPPFPMCITKRCCLLLICM